MQALSAEKANQPIPVTPHTVKADSIEKELLRLITHPGNSTLTVIEETKFLLNNWTAISPQAIEDIVDDIKKDNKEKYGLEITEKTKTAINLLNNKKAKLNKNTIASAQQDLKAALTLIQQDEPSSAGSTYSMKIQAKLKKLQQRSPADSTTQIDLDRQTAAQYLKEVTTEIYKYTEQCEEALSHRNADQMLIPILKQINDVQILEHLEAFSKIHAIYEDIDEKNQLHGFVGRQAFEERIKELKQEQSQDIRPNSADTERAKDESHKVSFENNDKKRFRLFKAVQTVAPIAAEALWEKLKSDIASKFQRKSPPTKPDTATDSNQEELSTTSQSATKKSAQSTSKKLLTQWARLQRWRDPSGLSEDQIILLLERKSRRQPNATLAEFKDWLTKWHPDDNLHALIENLCNTIIHKKEQDINECHLNIMKLAIDELSQDVIKSIASEIPPTNPNKAAQIMRTQAHETEQKIALFLEKHFETAYANVKRDLEHDVSGTLRKSCNAASMRALIESDSNGTQADLSSVGYASSRTFKEHLKRLEIFDFDTYQALKKTYKEATHGADNGFDQFDELVSSLLSSKTQKQLDALLKTCTLADVAKSATDRRIEQLRIKESLTYEEAKKRERQEAQRKDGCIDLKGYFVVVGQNLFSDAPAAYKEANRIEMMKNAAEDPAENGFIHHLLTAIKKHQTGNR